MAMPPAIRVMRELMQEFSQFPLKLLFQPADIV